MSIWRKSLPLQRTVCGFTIKKMPVGAYLTAVERLKLFPTELINAIFPGMDVGQILQWFKQMDEARISHLLGTILTTVPELGIALLADLTGIPQNQLLEDENIGLMGLMQIVKTFVEVNELESFFTQTRELITKLKVQRTGSSA